MNDSIQKMLAHASVRDFSDEKLSEEQVESLLLASQSGSTSHHVQAFSIIDVTDPELRQAFGEISHCGPYVEGAAKFYVFVADLYRMSTVLKAKGKDDSGLANNEALTVAMVDTAIAAQNMALASESMDLGICYIGGIRNDIAKSAELLKLPKYTVPLFGLCIGIPASRNGKKPRLPLTNQVSENSYDQAILTNVTGFDEEMRAYYASRGSNQKASDWSQQMADYMDHELRPDFTDFLKAQGFKLA
ncbi:oxygen-insensitive NADPH nitroreductase [Lactococcus termiticola]|uniref:Nitroreductase n=1 Tax=Lactococcus termiticola TaxID=2169526 RepID=A0A2R5HK42_9LACT|nr:oxygen-insensitive NADPH nitroreductase [Lactococcus termiticola]GBG97108.1 nitroreductase [Lactococcus termiticola]